MEFEKSASVSEAERQIKALQEENLRLRGELASVTSLYNQLVSEGKHEKYDERRVTFLKSQLIQVERQLVVFSDALSGRSSVLMEVENNLMSTADSLRSHLSPSHNEAKTSTTVKNRKVTLTEEDIDRVVRTIESCRIKLYKNVEINTSDKLAHPVMMIDKFIKSNTSKPVTLMDVCSGKIDHLNLKHVAKLETRLSQVYRQLYVISQSLHSILSEDESHNIAHVNAAVYKSLGGQVAYACKLLEEVTQDLLTLSILIPSAPWPMLNRPCLKDMTSETVLATLPNFQKNRASEGKVMIEGLMKAVNYSLQIKSLEADVLKQEIHMHQVTYRTQMEYTEALISSLMQGYASFEKETYELLCKPLKEIMDNYNLLSSNADETSLRIFLESFKEQSAQISTAIDLFTPKESNKEAFSAYSEAFHESLQKIQHSCQKERDEKVSNLDELKDYLQKALDELKIMFAAPPPTEETCSDNIDNEKVPKNRESTDKVTAKSPSRNQKVLNLERDFADMSMNSPESPQVRPRIKSKVKPTASDLTGHSAHVDCNCGAENSQNIPNDRADQSEASVPNTPTSTRLPSLKRPSSLPRLNRRGSQDSSSGPSSPLSRESTTKLRNSSSIPSPSAFRSYSSPKGVNMKKLVLVPKFPKEKDAKDLQEH